MYRLLILFSICLIGLSCSKNKLESIEIPENLEIDIDQDGNSEFLVTYLRRIEGDPAGNYEAVRMNLESVDNVKILKHDEEPPLFLNEIDLIQTEVNSPLYWETTNPSSNISTPLAKIRTDYDGTTWNDEWRILSSEEKETYLIGFKLIRDSMIQLGFIEFSIDSQTGKFILLNTELL